MIYPSHFFGMDGIAHPGDAPEHFIGESMDRFKLITKGSGVVIRPWLQRLPGAPRLTRRSMWKCKSRWRSKRAALDFFLERQQRLFEALHGHAGNAGGQRAILRGDEIGSKRETAAVTPVASVVAPVPALNRHVETGPAHSPATALTQRRESGGTERLLRAPSLLRLLFFHGRPTRAAQDSMNFCSEQGRRPRSSSQCTIPPLRASSPRRCWRRWAQRCWISQDPTQGSADRRRHC